jgi:hypothetical protein
MSSLPPPPPPEDIPPESVPPPPSSGPAVPSPGSTAPPPAPPTKSNARKWIVAVIVVAVLAIIGASAGSSGSNKPAASSATEPTIGTPTTLAPLPTTPTTTAAAYTAVFQPGGLEVIDPAEITVYITVTNTGGASGTPNCTINLSSPGGAYTGFDAVIPDNPIPAGGQESYKDTITVTNQGAQYVTQAASSVTCS